MAGNHTGRVMGYFKDRRVAERVAQRYTDSGHKQLYGVDEAPWSLNLLLCGVPLKLPSIRPATCYRSP